MEAAHRTAPARHRRPVRAGALGTVAPDRRDPSLNNDYRSFYARKLMRDEPALVGMFELRRSAADAWMVEAA
ncbi:hypothetical protein NKG94_23940 [Micromonospora sp. M12]